MRGAQNRQDKSSGIEIIEPVARLFQILALE
jgi:hypothetical protein